MSPAAEVLRHPAATPATEPIPNVYQRVARVMRDVRGVAKSQHNPQGRYNYAGHEAVTEALRDAYVRHGLVRTASVVKTELLDHGTVVLTVEVAWVNVDDPTDRMVVTVPGLQSSVTKAGTPTPVQIGMALSYAVKNAEFKCFALTGDDSPDPESQPEPDRVGGYQGNAAPANEAEPRIDGAALATAYLARFTECRTELDVQALREEIKADWQKVRMVPNFGEHVVTAMRRALARINGGGKKDRQPGEDG